MTNETTANPRGIGFGSRFEITELSTVGSTTFIGNFWHSLFSRINCSFSPRFRPRKVGTVPFLAFMSSSGKRKRMHRTKPYILINLWLTLVTERKLRESLLAWRDLRITFVGCKCVQQLAVDLGVRRSESGQNSKVSGD